MTKERADAIKAQVDEVGIDAVVETSGLTRETVRRAVRLSKSEDNPGVQIESEDSLVRKFQERFSIEEQRKIVNGVGLATQSISRPVYNFDGEEVCIGYCTDTHVGEETFSDALWSAFLTECKREGVELILHSGDVHEGISHRPDQMYHLRDLGVSAQMDHAERLFAMTDTPIKVISGNHDRWGIKSNGLFMVRDLADRFDDGHVEFIGEDFGEVIINGTKWMLWHGEDGSSYATSYRIQKIIESFTGGDKPNVLLCGHTHKQGYFFDRNVHAVSGGALSYQSSWMRATRKPCHTGFWIIRATIRDHVVTKFSPTWYPIYQ